MSGPSGYARPSQALLRTARSLSSRKGRREHGLFVADGAQAVREAVAVPGAVAWLLATEGNPHADEFAASAGEDVPTYLVDEREMARITDTVTPQGIAAGVRTSVIETAWSAATLPERPRLVVICAQVRDPGNAGTVVRCADAFGADLVILTEGSVELANPKTVRASVGSVFHLPVITGAPLAEATAWARARGLQVLAADGGGDSLPDVDLSVPTAWVMGNEAWGFPAADLALCDRPVGIPMWGRAESLNLSTAAAIALFATASAQRGH